MLTLHGYRLRKTDVSVEELKTTLTVKPYIPKVFVNPRFVQKFTVFKESAEYIYVPKHFGIEKYGVPRTERDVTQTPIEYWDFTGSLRATQLPVVNSFLLPEPHDGIISLHTGGGKTVCALYIASRLRLPTLVIVHNTFLRDQWIERAKAFLPKARIGRIQADVCELGDITIAMLQTLSMKELPAETFKSIGLVVVDECHHIASEVFSQAIPKLTSKYMLGLSATPSRKDGLMNVAHWLLGPLLYTSSTGDSSDRDIRVEMYEYKNDDAEFNTIIYNPQGVMFTSLMVNKLAECEHRTKWIAEIIKDIMEDDSNRQMLVLTDRVTHTKSLLEALPEAWKEKAAILDTKLNAVKRADACATKSILIATYSMCKEGFDVPTLNTLVMATPRPDVDQVVGRILRVEKSARKANPLIVDIVDPQFRRQFGERNALYKKRDYTIMRMSLDSAPLAPPRSSPWEQQVKGAQAKD